MIQFSINLLHEFHNHGLVYVIDADEVFFVFEHFVTVASFIVVDLGFFQEHVDCFIQPAHRQLKCELDHGRVKHVQEDYQPVPRQLGCEFSQGHVHHVQTRVFNQPIINWDASSVADMSSMFHGGVECSSKVDGDTQQLLEGLQIGPRKRLLFLIDMMLLQ